MLTLLRMRRVARLQRQPELDGASHPLRRAGSWQPSFFFGAIRDFTNPVALASNLQTTNLGVRSSNVFGRAILRQGTLPRPSRGGARVTNDSGVVRLARA
jgi:hypothetical protein